ncbi:gamma-glutamyltransferase family protein [Dactylosporangium sp. CA-092794]|uniref:gamma-glutamyltransferase family protein n=1 Tax=Dactylosporangium sp. CA-092794 TaxID=3239929 RepID=UPI003D933FAB
MASNPDDAFQARPDLTGSFGMCASTHWLASATGQSVLERGGNAFDAAVAAAFVLHVVEPHLNGPGGDLVALIAPAGAPPRVLSGQGPAPRGATIEHFTAEGLDLVPGAGALAAAVPGAVEAWLLLLRDHGTWELPAVLEYAVHYATAGHRIGAGAAETIAAVAPLFRDGWPTSAELWLSDGVPPRAGQVVRNPAYSETLTRLAREASGAGSRAERIDRARSAWSRGFVARDIDAFVRSTPHQHSTGTVHRGVLTADDMAAFAAGYEEPVAGSFRGTGVLKAGPWSQGPALLQTLAILDGLTDAELDLTTDLGVHHVVEALKLAMADREAYYGEDLPPADLRHLLSAGYARQRRALIGPAASHELRPGRLPGRAAPELPALWTARVPVARGGSVGEPTVSPAGVTRGDTCHLDVMDRWGNAISATPSGGWLQSSPAIPGLGFALGTRLQMTWLDPRSPSALRPGRRPRTTLTPTLLVRDGAVVSALGTPGGDQQEQWQVGYLVNALAAGLSPQRSIEAPAFHTTSFPSSFWPRTGTPGGIVVEDRLGDDVIRALAARGHVVTRAGDWTLGRLSSVSRDPTTGELSAAANPRGGQGYATGR